MSAYLKCNTSTFKGIQLKFKLRTGVAGIGEDLMRQKRGDGTCPMCGQFESLKHLMFNCKSYANERQILYNGIKESYKEDIFNALIQDPSSFMYHLLGDHDDNFNKHFLSFIKSVWLIRSKVL